MKWSETKKTRLLLEFFTLALVASILMTWYTMIVTKSYVVFTDEETVPEPKDFFTAIPAALQELWKR